MRPTIAVNLGGLQFIFDDNAYRLMREYLDSLMEVFRTQHKDADEITTDIENRCAEILSEKYDRFTYIITGKDIEDLIDCMGRPEEIMEDTADTGDSSSFESAQTPPTFTPAPPPIRKRLYRLGKGAELGGVCGGLAAYFGWDPTYVRLATVALAFLFGATIVVYMIMWLVVPKAVTPLQEMELRGESPTLDNIGDTVKKYVYGTNTAAYPGEYQNPYASQQYPPEKHKTALLISRLCSIVAKIIILGIILILIIGFIALCKHLFLSLIWHSPSPFQGRLYLCGSVLLLAGIPLVKIIWMMINRLSPQRTDPRRYSSWNIALLVIWIIALIYFLIQSSALGWDIPILSRLWNH